MEKLFLTVYNEQYNEHAYCSNCFACISCGIGGFHSISGDTMAGGQTKRAIFCSLSTSMAAMA